LCERTGRFEVIVFLAATVVVLGGCRAPSSGEHEATGARRGHDSAARRQEVEKLLARAAADRLDGRAARAKSSLLEAVRLEPDNGAARHDLGLVSLELGELHTAAVCFEEASRLLPGEVEPCYNLGLVLETAGKYRLAMDAYERALHRQADHLASLENLCRTRVRFGWRDRETLRLLTACLEREHRPEWVAWLRREMLQATGKCNVASSVRPTSLPVQDAPATTDPVRGTDGGAGERLVDKPSSAAGR